MTTDKENVIIIEYVNFKGDKMVVKFKTLIFQNILSFGSKPVVINFEHGVNLISGKNGSGKSSILDALSFCLFGQPYRKIKIKELVNRRNRKNLSVSCEFIVDEKDTFKITRTMNPDDIEILKNGEEIDLLSSKRLNQEEIDKIVGINYQMFKQVISLAVNYNRPFLSLGLCEKREIIEQIFNIVVFGQMLKYLKKNNVEIKTKNEINERTTKILEENLKSLRRRVSEITEAQNNFQSNKDKDLTDIDNRIKQYMAEKIKIDEEIETMTSNIDSSEYDEERIKELKKERDKVIKSINENEFANKNSIEQIELLDKNTVCPSCGNNITAEHKDMEIKKLSGENRERSNNVKELKSKRIEIEKEIHQQEKCLQERNENNNKKESLQERLNIIDREITGAEERRNEILNREIDFNLDILVKEFEEKKNEYKVIWSDSKSIKKKLKNNDIIQSILSESGIKAYFFKKLIPILNCKINEYIKLFELPVIIQFDELMNEKITNLENLRGEISYYAYSEGEKKRIDMSILLSFISITKIISNWNCNLLMIDELLDSAIDEGGLEKLVGSLKNMTYDSKDLCIYIISHRLQQEYSTHFKNSITIQKNPNSFSEVIFSKEA